MRLAGTRRDVNASLFLFLCLSGCHVLGNRETRRRGHLCEGRQSRFSSGRPILYLLDDLSCGDPYYLTCQTCPTVQRAEDEGRNGATIFVV